jgi:ABC-type branched-subunit amino acid transport system substrate-binding protein
VVRPRRTRAVVAVAAICLVVLAGCRGNSPATPSANKTGTAGLTAKTITVGTIADLTGPVPGLFQGAVNGVKAYFAYVNSTGGVDGRTLVDDPKDSALSCATTDQDAATLESSVFAIVGSFDVYDSCTRPVFEKDPRIPYIGVVLDSMLGALPNVFSPAPTPPGYGTGPFKYVKQRYGVSRIAFIAGAGAQEPIESYEFEAAQSAGITLAYKRFAEPTESDFTADVVRMRRANVDWVDLSALAISQGAHVIQEMAAQNFYPKVIEVDTAYTQQFFKLFPTASLTNNIVVSQGVSRFLGEDAATVPAVSTFDTWMKKTNGSFQPDLYSVYGWTSAELFVQALRQAGSNPSQAGVLAALKTVTSFDAHGLIATSNPAAKLAATCYVVLQIENVRYKKIYPSGKGFACKPGGRYAPPSQ